MRTLRTRGRPVASQRRICFWLGIATISMGLLLPDTRFWTHMSQHLLLGDIGALFIVLGLDGALLRPLLAAPGVRHLRFLAHPLVALPAWIVALGVWHLSGPYDTALHHEAVHAAQHVSFFLAGALVWAAVVEPLPGPAWFGTGPKAVYALVVRVWGAVVASVFIWSGRSFYDGYSLHDQRIGGLIMFTEGGIVTLVVFGWLFLRWQAEAERRQQLIEQGYDSRLARRTARHWPRLQQPPGRAGSVPSPAAPDTPSE